MVFVRALPNTSCAVLPRLCPKLSKFWYHFAYEVFIFVEEFGGFFFIMMMLIVSSIVWIQNKNKKRHLESFKWKYILDIWCCTSFFQNVNVVLDHAKPFDAVCLDSICICQCFEYPWLLRLQNWIEVDVPGITKETHHHNTRQIRHSQVREGWS